MMAAQDGASLIRGSYLRRESSLPQDTTFSSFPSIRVFALLFSI
jgi:hypothetical protein